jgi:hypothetical protein
VPIPTREFEVSILKTPDWTLKAVVDESSVSAADPDVEVNDNAPVVRVRPLEAVRVEEKRPVPVTSSLVPGLLLPIPTLYEARSG